MKKNRRSRNHNEVSRRIPPRRRTSSWTSLCRAGSWGAYGDAWARETGDRRSPGSRSQAPDYLCRDRSLCNRRRNGGDRLPSGQAGVEIPRLGQGGCDLRGRKQRPRSADRCEGVVKGVSEGDASRSSGEEQAADARLQRDEGKRSVRRAVGNSEAAAGRVSWL